MAFKRSAVRSRLSPPSQRETLKNSLPFGGEFLNSLPQPGWKILNSLKFFTARSFNGFFRYWLLVCVVGAAINSKNFAHLQNQVLALIIFTSPQKTAHLILADPVADRCIENTDIKAFPHRKHQVVRQTQKAVQLGVYLVLEPAKRSVTEQYDAYLECHETLKNRTSPHLWLRYGGDELLLEKKH